MTTVSAAHDTAASPRPRKQGNSKEESGRSEESEGTEMADAGNGAAQVGVIIDVSKRSPTVIFRDIGTDYQANGWFTRECIKMLNDNKKVFPPITSWKFDRQ